MVREDLAPYLGKRDIFYATFVRHGQRNVMVPYKINFVSKVVRTLLLSDVKNRFGRDVADHIWFTESKQWKEADLQPGDTVKFKATVEAYTKRDRDSDEYQRIDDYKLSYPFGVVKVSATLVEAGQLTL